MERSFGPLFALPLAGRGHRATLAHKALLDDLPGDLPTFAVTASITVALMKRAFPEFVTSTLTVGRLGAAICYEAVAQEFAGHGSTFGIAATIGLALFEDTPCVVLTFKLAGTIGDALSFETAAQEFAGQGSTFGIVAAIGLALFEDTPCVVLTFNLAGTIGGAVQFKTLVENPPSLLGAPLLAAAGVNARADVFMRLSVAAVLAGEFAPAFFDEAAFCEFSCPHRTLIVATAASDTLMECLLSFRCASALAEWVAAAVVTTARCKSIACGESAFLPGSTFGETGFQDRTGVDSTTNVTG